MMCTGQMNQSFVTILFTDLVGSSALFGRVGDEEADAIRREHFDALRRAVDEHGGREVKSTGDGFLALFDGPARAIRCAVAIQMALREEGVEVRVGLHSGEVELREGDVGGIAVHVGARVAAAASPGEVVVSSTVRDLVAGSGIGFADRGEHDLKGVPDRWHLYAVTEPVPA
jgi:class 3 adenylate cyclase